MIFTEAVGAYRMIQQPFRMECISQKLAKMAQHIVPFPGWAVEQKIRYKCKCIHSTKSVEVINC